MIGTLEQMQSEAHQLLRCFSILIVVSLAERSCKLCFVGGGMPVSTLLVEMLVDRGILNAKIGVAADANAQVPRFLI